MTGPGDVKGERMGPSPLAVSELAKEFRRLAAEAEKKREYYQFDRQAHAGFAVERNTWNRAAQMLEEKLS